MQTSKSIAIPLLLLLILGYSFSGCATSQGVKNPALAPQSKNSSVSGRMMIRESSMVIEIENVENAITQTKDLISKKGGYIESENLINAKRAIISIRIPSSILNTTLDGISQFGVELSRQITSEDITESYIDTDARLKNAIALRDRLRKLLDRAMNVQDILSIEREMTRVQAEIDSMEGILKSLKSRVDYSLISVEFKTETILGPIGYIGYGLGWVIKKLFIIK